MPREASLNRNRFCGKRPVVTHTEPTVPILGTLKAAYVPPRHVVTGHCSTGVPPKPSSLGLVVLQSRQMEQKVVRGMRAGDRVHGHDARRNHPRVVHVRVTALGCRRHRLVLQPCRVDQPVAPQTPVQRWGRC